MKICIVAPTFPLDEEDYRAAFSLDFARALEQLGQRVVVHAPDRSDRPEGEAGHGLDVRWFPWSGGHQAIARSRLWHPSDLYDLVSLTRNGQRSLLELICREGVETCLALWAVPCGVFARRAWLKTGIPYAVWALGSDLWKYGRLPFFRHLVRVAFRDAHHCFADGFDLAEQVTALSGRRCSFLPTSRKLPPATVEREPGRDRPVRFLFVGRFDEVKGVDLLPPAAALLLRERQDFEIYVFGEGPLASGLSQEVQRLGVAGHVHVGGRLSRSEFADELVLADALLIPSRMESIPVVMTDALQKGVPVLVSDVGDMGRLVRRFRVGMVFAPNDPHAVADSLRSFLSRDAGRDYDTDEVMRQFSVEAAADKFLQAVRRAPGRPAP